MEIKPEINDLINELSQRSARAEQSRQRLDIDMRRDVDLANAHPDDRQAFIDYHERERAAADSPAAVQAGADRVAVELRNRVARMPAPAAPPRLTPISARELRGRHPACRYAWWESDSFAGPDLNQRAFNIAARMNEQRDRFHHHRVEDVHRHAYATALEVSPNLLCFTEFQRIAATDAQRTTRSPRPALTDAQHAAVQEARVIAQGAAVYLRRRARATPINLGLVLPSCSPFHGMAMERGAVLATVIGSEGPAAGMVHALYGALFTSADRYLNEHENANWEGARIHLTHASHIFGAFCAHNGNVPFDPPLEALVVQMRDDIDAGRGIGPIEPLIYALADALTNY